MPKRQRRLQRNMKRPLVVQRTLLPKTQVPTRQIMTLTMLPTNPTSQTGSFMQVVASPAFSIQSTNEEGEAGANQGEVDGDRQEEEVPAATSAAGTCSWLQSFKGKAPLRRIIPTPVPTNSGKYMMVFFILGSLHLQDGTDFGTLTSY